MMTDEELYAELKRINPTWTDEQIWTQISIMKSTGEHLNDHPACEVSEDVLKIILEKAKDWLFNKLPDIFEQVYTFFDDLIESLPDWAKQGIKYAIKLIGQYYRQN